ncbi:hypothetical protein VKT23_002542 [Stygiomarasmius scandens]|uniref:F-box domain-containing protein n=1 Tax=Marasmiellus scandens TaxID=2682957 RepID=A0ABR1K2Q8_9AGAR
MSNSNLCVECHSKSSSVIGSESLSSSGTVRLQLRSGYRLTTEEASQIQSQITGIGQDIDQCVAKMTSLRTELDKLQDRKSKLEQLANNCRALLSPIRRLPLEILAEILVQYCADKPSLVVRNSAAPVGGTRRARYQSTGPLLPSHVCKLWHDVALSPGLWSNLDLNLSFGAGINNLICLYLSRSHLAPLTLRISALKRNGLLRISILPQTRQSFNTIFCEAYRWKRVSLHLHPRLLCEIALTVEHKKFSVTNLKDLEISRAGGYIKPDSSFWNLFRSVPSLNTLSLVHFDPSLPLPFAQLKSVTIVDDIPGDPDLSQLFVACPAMQELNLSLATYDAVGSQSSPVFPNITHHNLRSMSLRLQWSGPASNLISSVVVPNLRCLVLKGDPSGRTTPESHQKLIGMLQRSACRLESLTLELIAMHSDKELLELLTLMPTVTHFTLILDSPRITPSVFVQILTIQRPTTKPNILPNLTHLYVDMSAPSRLPSSREFSSMIESRARGPDNDGPRRLECLQLFFQPARRWPPTKMEDVIASQRFISSIEPCLLRTSGLQWRFELPVVQDN